MFVFFFKTRAALNLSFPTRTASTYLSQLFNVIYKRLVAAILMIFTLEKANEDSMIEKLNMSRPVRNIYDKFIWLASADHIKTASDAGIILASGKKKKQNKKKNDYYCKIKETLFIHELTPAPNINVDSEKLLPFIFAKLFYCNLTKSFSLKRL